MVKDQDTRQIFENALDDSGVVAINSRCRVQSLDGYRVVSAMGVVIAHYPVGDRMNEAYAMVNLVEQGLAKQKEVARAFECTDRTVRRYQDRYETGGISALGRPAGYPRGRPRLLAAKTKRIEQWMSEGVAKREIARRLGITDKAVRKTLRRLGWKAEAKEQLALPISGADPKLSASGSPHGEQGALQRPYEEPSDISGDMSADPNLSGFSSTPLPQWFLSMDGDPADRSVDRFLASKGLLDDAVPWFRNGKSISGVGVLLALPALVEGGVFDIARQIYGSIGPAFYGLRTTVVTFLLMSLLRIKRAEGLKEHPPDQLGRLLGLDRAMEVKTLRQKLTRLATLGRGADFGRALAQHRVQTRGHALGFLYVDGHVRAYHGKRKLPKTHLARMRISMPASTDYWVNDAEGEPLFLVNTEANLGLVKVLPAVLDEVRQLVGDRRVTVVFDRGGWSPKLFRRLIAADFDVLTYRKGRFRRTAKSCFAWHKANFDGKTVRYQLADQNILLDKRKLKMRQVTRLSANGHQTPIVTSRRDLSAIEIAYRMFERWRQENFFKYLREEYALDALVDYGTEPADPERDVPNPMRKKLDADLRKAYARLTRLQANYGFEAYTNQEDLRRTMRGFKIAHAELGQDLIDAVRQVVETEKRRAAVPQRVPVRSITEGQVIKLRIEHKLLTDLFKMVAYQAESELVQLIAPFYRRTENEGRTLIQNCLASSGDIDVTGEKLLVSLQPLSSPHKTQTLIALCDKLNQTKTRYPGTKLLLHFDVLPQPETSMAFPGARPANTAQPDIFEGA